jgi:hypothetical protein
MAAYDAVDGSATDIALANSERMSATGPSECANALIAWAMMARNESYRTPPLAPA